MKPVGAIVTLSMQWEGPLPKLGDALRTRTGRRYAIRSMNGRRWRCEVLAKDVVVTGATYEMFWHPRGRKKPSRVPLV